MRAQRYYLPVILCLLFAFGRVSGLEFQILQAPGDNGNGETPLLDPIFFGVGVAMEPLTKDLLVTGVDQGSQRYFAALYTPQSTANGAYVPQSSVFFGDPVGSNLTSPASTDDPGIVAPMCLSSGSSWIALGMRPDGYSSTGSVIIARKVTTTSTGLVQFVLQTRLYSDMVPVNSTYFPGDMVCTRDMEKIYVSEVSKDCSGGPCTSRLNIFQHTGSTWLTERTEDYVNGTYNDVLPVAITSNGGVYVFRSSEGIFLYIRFANGTLVDWVDLSPLSIVPKQVSISSTGRWLVISDPACLNYVGCAFAIQFNATSKRYNPYEAIMLTSPLVTPANCMLGYSLTMGSNYTTRHYPVVVLGAPGCPETLIGSGLDWVAQADPITPTETDWVPANATLDPFGPSIAAGMRTGAMSWSHNFISDDQLVVALGAPGSGNTVFETEGGGRSPGRVYIFKYFLPTPPPTPTTPVTPYEQPSISPADQATIDSTRAMLIAVIVIAVVAVSFAFLVVLKACSAWKEYRLAKELNSRNRRHHNDVELEDMRNLRD